LATSGDKLVRQTYTIIYGRNQLKNTTERIYGRFFQMNGELSDKSKSPVHQWLVGIGYISDREKDSC
jgi:hypothetical protein